MYFAYGSNMSSTHLQRLCPGAELVGVANLKGYRFIINRVGYATLLADVSAEAFGILWRVAGEDETTLDAYEGYEDGLYDKCVRRVQGSARQAVDALVYIDHRNQQLGPPKDQYLEALIAAAEENYLPEHHVHLLRVWPRRSGFRAINTCINKIKAGDGISERVSRYAADIAEQIRRRRDTLLLQVLEDPCVYEDEENLQERFWELALEEAEAIADCCYGSDTADSEDERQALLQYLVALDAARRFDWALPGEANYQPERGEIGTAGVIIASHPRDHGIGDRFVVSPHAGRLAQLWDFLMCRGGFPLRGVRPPICVFADAAEQHADETDFRALLNAILDELEQDALALVSTSAPQYNA